MSDRAALFEAVLDAPGDDAPRLVFADWLDENGEPERADVIRLQVEAACTPDYERRKAALNARADELIRTAGAAWRLPSIRARDQVFRRGFVEEITIPGEVFQQSGTDLFRQTPLRYARFPNLVHLASLTWDWILTTRLAGVEFPVGLPGNRAVWLGLAWPHLRWLKTQNLDTTQEFLRTVACPNLEALDLSHSNHADVVLESFLPALRFERLRALALDAAGNQVDSGYHPHKVKAGGARRLAECEGLATLTELHLRFQAIGDAGLFHLASSPHLARLEQLYLRNNEIGAIGPQNIEDFCASPYLTRLTVLDLSGNPLRPAGATALSQWPGLRKLRWLDVSDCDLTQDAGRILARSPEWHPRLRVRADGNRFDPQLVFPASALG